MRYQNSIVPTTTLTSTSTSTTKTTTTTSEGFFSSFRIQRMIVIRILTFVTISLSISTFSIQPPHQRHRIPPRIGSSRLLNSGNSILVVPNERVQESAASVGSTRTDNDTMTTTNTAGVGDKDDPNDESRNVKDDEPLDSFVTKPDKEEEEEDPQTLRLSSSQHTTNDFGRMMVHHELLSRRVRNHRGPRSRTSRTHNMFRSLSQAALASTSTSTSTVAPPKRQSNDEQGDEPSATTTTTRPTANRNPIDDAIRYKKELFSEISTLHHHHHHHNENENGNGNDDQPNSSNVPVTAAATGTDTRYHRIKSTVQTILRQQENTRDTHTHTHAHAHSSTNPIVPNAATPPPPTKEWMGLFGERIRDDGRDDDDNKNEHDTDQLQPGAVLIPPSLLLSEEEEAPSPLTPAAPSAPPISDAISIRIATPEDYVSIANLRWSVFSNCLIPKMMATTTTTKTKTTTPTTTSDGDDTELYRRKFCARSSQAIESRRRKGALCLVATVPKAYKGDVLASSKNKARGVNVKLHLGGSLRGWGGISQRIRNRFSDKSLSSSSSSSHRHHPTHHCRDDPEQDLDEEWIVGTVECSTHEFYGTLLGKERRRNKIMYITEVAVSPDARMIGVGTKLLQGVDELARIQQMESLYLHVEVKNDPALGLYRKAGYDHVEADEKHGQFTYSLNLHDGFGGKYHYLLRKHLRTPTTTTLGKNGSGNPHTQAHPHNNPNRNGPQPLSRPLPVELTS